MFDNVKCVWGKKADIVDSAIHESELKRGKFLIALECLLSFEASWITQFLNNHMINQTYGMTFNFWLKNEHREFWESNEDRTRFSMTQIECKTIENEISSAEMKYD